MTKADHVVVGIHVQDRVAHASQVQDVLTRFGRNIKTRVGLHEPAEGGTAANGLIIVETVGDAAQIEEFLGELGRIQGVDTQEMVFEHT